MNCERMCLLCISFVLRQPPGLWVPLTQPRPYLTPFDKRKKNSWTRALLRDQLKPKRNKEGGGEDEKPHNLIGSWCKLHLALSFLLLRFFQQSADIHYCSVNKYSTGAVVVEGYERDDAPIQVANWSLKLKCNQLPMRLCYIISSSLISPPLRRSIDRVSYSIRSIIVEFPFVD